MSNIWVKKSLTMLVFTPLISTFFIFTGNAGETAVNDLDYHQTLKKDTTWCDVASGERYGESIVIGDVDRDSNDDVIVGSEESHDIYVYYGLDNGDAATVLIHNPYSFCFIHTNQFPRKILEIHIPGKIFQ